MNDLSLLVVPVLFVAVGLVALLSSGLADRERSNAREVFFRRFRGREIDRQTLIATLRALDELA